LNGIASFLASITNLSFLLGGDDENFLFYDHELMSERSVVKKDSREIIKELEESIRLMREYLEKKKLEKRKNPEMSEDLIINGLMRANEALIKLVERTEALGSIRKAVWVMTAELTIILALILIVLPKLLTLTA